LPKSFQVDITAAAEGDVNEIRAFIARDKPEAAAKWVETISRQFRALERNPERHEVIPEAGDLGVEYRHQVFGSYRTIYRIEGARVIIVRVIHGSRLLAVQMFLD
jgi:plasmid stabilization system protein ParE